ncbi:hypothetical protein POM88_010960 [Heracleum sosnowskyi]|uniref:Uncharacterized protein n=1 Tax=Heracleum sosnowskyi TaxID=360622 RepID=A0AAD8IVD8_9APIA|nr:hypothetical protein POM88_010960 [Heracleum sosnowskyi]
MTNNTYKSPLAILLLVTATLLAVVGHYAATAQEVQTCFYNCRLRLISCASGCRIGAAPFPVNIRYCLGQCSFQNFQCIQICSNPSRPPPRRPRRPILPPIFHRPPRRPRRPRRPILPPIFHRPPRTPEIPPITPILPKAPEAVLPSPQKLSSSLIYRQPPLPSSSTLDPLPSSSKSSSISAIMFPLPQPLAQVDNFEKGN